MQEYTGESCCALYTEKSGQSWNPLLVMFGLVDVNRSFLRFSDFRSSMWAPKCPRRKSLFCGEGGLKMVLAKRLLR